MLSPSRSSKEIHATRPGQSSLGCVSSHFSNAALASKVVLNDANFPESVPIFSSATAKPLFAFSLDRERAGVGTASEKKAMRPYSSMLAKNELRE